MSPAGAFLGVDAHFAPPLIQSRMALTSAAVSALFPGGICDIALAAHGFVEQALIRAFTGDDGGAALCRPSGWRRRSRRSRSDMRAAPWQAAHLFSRMVTGEFSQGDQTERTIPPGTAPARSGVTDAFLPLRPFEMPWTLYFVEESVRPHAGVGGQARPTRQERIQTGWQRTNESRW